MLPCFWPAPWRRPSPDRCYTSIAAIMSWACNFCFGREPTASVLVMLAVGSRLNEDQHHDEIHRAAQSVLLALAARQPAFCRHDTGLCVHSDPCGKGGH